MAPAGCYEPIYPHVISSFHRPVQVLSLAGLVFHALLLAGCTSTGPLASIYIVSLASTRATNAVTPLPVPNNATERDAEFVPLEIRVGYFSRCANVGRSLRSPWVCGSGVNEHLSNVLDPWNLDMLASDFKDKVVSPALNVVSALAALGFMCLISLHPLPIWKMATGRHKVSATTLIIQYALSIHSALLASLSLAAVMRQHVSAATLAPLLTSVTAGTITAEVGLISTTIAWVAFWVWVLSTIITMRVVQPILTGYGYFVATEITRLDATS
ncbi:hypothetical protein VTJ83DRAFT_7011 [Remersonia thermophila]|uniref:Uncharacterized protein n=1 Tax=Remersonia thermophila TaxID=72144 RepID=A0ABR4D3S4_9PEZI